MRVTIPSAYEVTIPKVIRSLAFVKIVGRGSYGVVLRAVHTETEN
jgi:hypothetical protein